jgi:hypothetical protein
MPDQPIRHTFFLLLSEHPPVKIKQNKIVTTMKTINVLRSLMLMAILAVAAPTVNAAPTVDPVEQKAEIQRLENRLEEIKAIDKTKLNKEEKKALRGEVKQIKKEIKAVSGGVYLSVGAILLIALLLILLL